jgi:hypothetical protein
VKPEKKKKLHSNGMMFFHSPKACNLVMATIVEALGDMIQCISQQA